MSNSGRVIKGEGEGDGPFSRMSVEPVVIRPDGETKARPAAASDEGQGLSVLELAGGAGEPAAVQDGASAHSLAEARQQAGAFLELARQGADDLKREAEEYASRIRAEAEAEAEERRSSAELEVSARLTQEYAEQYREAVHALAEAAIELKRRRDDYLSEIEGPAFELVLALGRRLLGAAWERDDTLRSALREALNMLRPEGAVSLYLNPATLERARADSLLQEQLSAGAGGRLEIQLLADETLPPAGFRLDTGSSSVGLDLNAALDELMGRLSKANAQPAVSAETQPGSPAASTPAVEPPGPELEAQTPQPTAGPQAGAAAYQEAEALPPAAGAEDEPPGAAGYEAQL